MPAPHSPQAVRAARDHAGFTREAAAFMAGVSVAAVQDAERGRDSRGSTLAALAGVYGVTIDSFFIHDPEADTPASAGEESTPESHEPGAASDSSGARLVPTGG